MLGGRRIRACIFVHRDFALWISCDVRRPNKTCHTTHLMQSQITHDPKTQARGAARRLFSKELENQPRTQATTGAASVGLGAAVVHGGLLFTKRLLNRVVDQMELRRLAMHRRFVSSILPRTTTWAAHWRRRAIATPSQRRTCWTRWSATNLSSWRAVSSVVELIVTRTKNENREREHMRARARAAEDGTSWKKGCASLTLGNCVIAETDRNVHFAHRHRTRSCQELQW